MSAFRPHWRAAACTVLAWMAIVLAPPAGAGEVSLEAMSATRIRPLFSPTRRPPPPPPAAASTQTVAAAPASPSPPDVTLTAVVIGTDLRVAVFKRGTEAKSLSVAAGGEIEGWRVTSIEPREVQMQRDDEVITFPLVKRPGKAPATVAPTNQRRADNRSAP
jgi:hypothetical protein